MFAAAAAAAAGAVQWLLTDKSQHGALCWRHWSHAQRYQ